MHVNDDGRSWDKGGVFIWAKPITHLFTLLYSRKVTF